jgi:hypothetical protein
VYRQSPTQVGYYDYHRWVTNPSATVTTSIIGALRSSGLFSEVELSQSDGTRHLYFDAQLSTKMFSFITSCFLFPGRRRSGSESVVA